MVGNRDVVIPPPGGGLGDLVNGAVAVGIVGVDVQVTADIVEGDQVGQGVRAGGLDLAAVFPEFGGNPVKADPFIDFLLRPSRQPSGAPVEPVLVNLPPFGEGDFAQLDVVGLGAGKVEQGGPEARRRYDAEVGLEAGAQDHGGLRLAGGEDLADFAVA